MASADQLLSEFIDAWNLGERPSVDRYLERAAAGEGDELAALIHTFLEDAPTPNFSPETLAEIAREPPATELASLIDSGSGTWPSLLPMLRRRAQMTRDQVVARLAAALDIAGREPKVKRYYHQMEAGTIDPAGVSRGVLRALGGVLGVSLTEIEQAGDFGAPAPAAGGLHFRVADDVVGTLEDADFVEAPRSPGIDEDVDEVDRLFLGGR